jgi:Kef-type K+ transport system membrane component KefB
LSYTDRDTAHVLAALVVLVVSAHGCGYVFARFRQPPVIGEIVGGLLLGPTLLERVWPAAHDWLFPATGATPAVLGAVYQLGLLLLMFTAGTQVRSLVSRSAARTVGCVAVAGLVFPFLAGLGLFTAMDFTRFEGTAHNRTALLIVFAIAIAVTSIPVISRIMLDLGLLGTRFARIVLTVAVIEDVVLYVALAVAVGMAAGTGTAQFGLAGALGWDPGSAANNAYHTLATVVFLGVGLLAGPRFYGALLRSRYNLIKRRSQVAFQLVFLIVMSGLCLLLSIVPLFGAFVAGIVVVSVPGERAEIARAEIGHFALGLFIPVYFAIVGLQLDLVGNFDVLFFVAFLLFACLAKSASVYAGARVAGEPVRSAVDLAIAMNARGGPGIVLASTAFAAGIIDARFYTTLVMLAIVTSLIAGTWLQRSMAASARAVPEGADALATEVT